MRTAVVTLRAAVLTLTVISGCAPLATLPAPSPTGAAPGFTANPLAPTLAPEIAAVEQIRADLELPDLPLTFMERTGMINSPGGDLPVAIYQDSAGRRFSVDPASRRVVEIDARSLLADVSPNTPAMPLQALRSRAMRYFQAAIPNFQHLQSAWKYEEGAKGDYFFFSWYDRSTPVSFMPPFAQIGLQKSGMLFAYYDTLLLNPQ